MSASQTVSRPSEGRAGARRRERSRRDYAGMRLLGYTPAEAAAYVGISRSTAARWEPADLELPAQLELSASRVREGTSTR